MNKLELKYLIREKIEQFLGKGGSKEVFSSPDSTLVNKKFISKINKNNILKEKKLGEKYPNYIAKIENVDFEKNILTQEKLNTNKFKTDTILALSEEGQEIFDESDLDDEFEFLVKNPQYNKNSTLKLKIQKLNNFVNNILLKKEGINIEKLDYPNINNVGYDKENNLKMLEIFY